MADIKVKDKTNKDIKTLDKGKIITEKIKDNIVDVKEKTETSKEDNTNEYGANKINSASNIVAQESVYSFKKISRGSIDETKDNIKKAKIKVKAFKEKQLAKKASKSVGKSSKTAIKTSKEVSKNAKKVAKESMKASQRAVKMARETARKTAQGIKVAVKTTISSIKAIIAGTKALIAALIAGGSVAMIVIIVICLVGLLVGSIFGIFFSGEKTSKNGITMKEVIAECNQEFSNKLQTIQDENPHDEYVLDGSMATWKDVLLVYSVKQSNGKNEQEVITVDNKKKESLKQIFWDMNSLSLEVKTEKVTEQGVNTDEMPTEVEKQVLHIKITSKTAEQMKNEYHFNNAQIKQFDELNSPQYASLWSGIVYGISDSGDFVNWRQKNAPWSNIRIGNTSSTVGDIGCLVTSIAILIEKSGVNTNINPFNPGTFVEGLNQNNGFDNSGNLQYAAVNKVVPNFGYMGNVNLRGKTRDEKLNLISQYFNMGYFITAEVKGATQGNQHWVAIVGIDGDRVVMVDPGSNHTDMWNAYEFSKTSQFNYFRTYN